MFRFEFFDTDGSVVLEVVTCVYISWLDGGIGRHVALKMLFRKEYQFKSGLGDLVWFHSLTVKQNPFKILSADSTSAGATFHLSYLHK